MKNDTQYRRFFSLEGVALLERYRFREEENSISTTLLDSYGFEKLPSSQMVYGVQVDYINSKTLDSKFWDLWKNKKDEIKRNGFVVSKDSNGRFRLYRKSMNPAKNGDVPSKVDKYEATPTDEEVELKITNNIFDWQIPYVKKALAALKKNKAMLDASMTGAGKTFITLAVIREVGCPFIVISPKAVLSQWHEACELMGVKPTLVSNYEQIKLGKTSYYKAGPPNKSGSNMVWDVPPETVIIFDEAHKTKNYGTGNSKILQDAHAQGLSIYMLSATIGENPLKMRAAGEALHLFDNYWKWATSRGVVKGKYGMEFGGGAKDMEKIHADIFDAKKGVRVGKAELEKQLPPLHSEVKLIEFGKTSGIKKAYDKLKSEIDSIISDKGLGGSKSGHILAARTRARQQIELMKMPEVIELAEDLQEEGNSVAIFVNFNETLKFLSSKLKTDCIISGSMGDREKSKNDFNSGKSKIVLVNIKAGGTGISLHDTNGNAPRVGLLMPTDSAQELYQATGRLWRAGAKSPAANWFIIAKGTIEEAIGKNVKAKINNLNSLNDGELAEPFLPESFREAFIRVFSKLYG